MGYSYIIIVVNGGILLTDGEKCMILEAKTKVLM
jgi:hypothetical protein